VKKDGSSLLVEAGDFLFKSYNIHSAREVDTARLMLQFYDEMGYAVAGIGRRDLASPGFLEAEAAKRKLVFLSANIKSGSQKAFKKYVTIDVDGVTIGLTALTSGPYRAQGLEVTEPMDGLHRVLPELRKKADLVVVLSNLGENLDKRMAYKEKEIDLIISGGPGSSYYKSMKIGDVYLLRTLPKGKSIGVAELTLDGTGKIVSFDTRQVLLDSSLPVDQEALQKIAETRKKVYNEVSHADQKMRAKAVETNPFLRAVERAKKKRETSRLSKNENEEAIVPDNAFIELLKGKQTEKGKESMCR